MYKKEGKNKCWKKRKVIVFERKEAGMVDFSTPYRVSVPVVGNCYVM